MHLVITGRSVHPSLLALADLVSTIDASADHQLKNMLKHLKDLYAVWVAVAYTKRIVHLCCGY
jgi:ABC-type oligopeptide transport system ATPase subunit